VPLRTRLTDEEVARFSAQHFRFPGVEVQARLFRQYPLGETASHVIGYIGRINQRRGKAIEDRRRRQLQGHRPYRQGRPGEKLRAAAARPDRLRGSRGIGRRPRHPHLSRTAATPGSNLILSIDIELQKVVEEAFGDRRGALVAIEPETGDILAYVSRPGYDPNLFVDGIDTQSWNELNTSLDRPMVNRPLSGTYAPGSTFKPFMALAALELGKRTPGQTTYDPGFFTWAATASATIWWAAMATSTCAVPIIVSCNTYYYRSATTWASTPSRFHEAVRLR
jgi:penicillin-binding protein 2